MDLALQWLQLLRYLVQHPGRVVTRDVLRDEVWGLDH